MKVKARHDVDFDWDLQDERSRGEKAAERVRAVKQWRADLAERQSAARELRVARNRFVLRAHERLMRDANRQKDDDRTRRMDALKVHHPSLCFPHRKKDLLTSGEQPIYPLPLLQGACIAIEGPTAWKRRRCGFWKLCCRELRV